MNLGLVNSVTKLRISKRMTKNKFVITPINHTKHNEVIYEENGWNRYEFSKALNGIQWKVAHPLPLNYGAPISSRDATMCVSGGGTPYLSIECLHCRHIWLHP